MDQEPCARRRDRTRDNFVRAALRLMKRCDQISRRYSADVYILVRWQHKHYEYRSANDSAFPDHSIDLVSSLYRILRYCRLTTTEE